MNREEMAGLDEKIYRIFGDVAINKKRLPATKLDKKGVPAYVAEWAIDTLAPGTGELTKEEIDRIVTWADKFIPGPKESQAINNRLYNGETVKVLNPLEAEIILWKKHKGKVIEGKFGILKLLNMHIIFMDSNLVDLYPELLYEGMWGLVELGLGGENDYYLKSFQPMQATVDIELFKQARKEFSLQEWIALLITSMGYDATKFDETHQLILLSRLLPLVQKSMHMIELAPKGTGKSYFYENVSPRVRIVSGGTLSPAVLFVNNANNQWGLLARYKTLVLDEIQTAVFEKPGEIVGTLKGFLANGKLTRGGKHETSSDCSLVMLANIELDDRQRPVNEDYFGELPEFLRETAFIDRLKALVPGWETRKLDTDSFAKNVGLKMDFFGDAMIGLREDLSFDQYCARRIELLGKGYKRNGDAVQQIASGMLKLLFPDLNVSDEDFKRYCVDTGVKYRQLVWDQLYAGDAEYRQYEPRIEYRIH